MIIRLATEQDGDAIAAIYRPAVTDGTASFELDSPDGAARAVRVAVTLERTPWIVCESADGVLGYAHAGRHRDRPAYRWSVEVSAYVRVDVARRRERRPSPLGAGGGAAPTSPGDVNGAPAVSAREVGLRRRRPET